MSCVVVDLQDRRPIWRLPDSVVADIARELPPGWELVLVDAPTSGDGDGTGQPSPDALAAVATAEIYFGYGVPAELLRAGPGLRWVHTGTAGVGASLTPQMLERDVVFTNSAGVHGPPMAETVIGMILHFARGFDMAVRAQAAGRWDKSGFDASDSPVREVAGSTVGIIGYGGIGREVARRAGALGARVLALKRRAAEVEPGVELVYGPDGLVRLLAESDWVVLTAPATPATVGLLGEAAIGCMRQGAVLVNVSRGTLVDEDALVAALSNGRLRGAALDVFAVEPLPPDHPFWSLPNVLVTPHVSACTRGFWEREAALLRENLRRYFRGEPLRNVVDKRAGY